MSYRFFYIGPNDVILLLQDAFTRAKKAGLTAEILSAYAIVPQSDQHKPLNWSKFHHLVRQLREASGNAVLFYDADYDPAQRELLQETVKDVKVIIYPLRRPLTTQEDTARAALMMMSTPVWTEAYLRDALARDDAFLAEYERLLLERNALKHQLALLGASPNTDTRTILQVVADMKENHHPHRLVITKTTERTAANCTFADAAIADEALSAIADCVTSRQKNGKQSVELKQYFEAKGFYFAPTNTAATKAQEGEHYKVKHEDVEYYTHMHLKKGPFRVYFALEGEIALIGAIGDHLPTAGYDD